jgi:WbqC-like protein family
MNELGGGNAVFATAYFPSVEYMMLVQKNPAFIIDPNDRWKRQTLRNRTHILSPNGIQMLSVPVEAKSHPETLTKDIKISYQQPWIRVHKGALEAAYNTTAFFEYFKDDIWAIFDQKPTYLIDLNENLLQLMLKKFKIKKLEIEASKIAESSSFVEISNGSDNTPQKLPFDEFRKYPQVFSYKHEFGVNLAAIDLLANCGNF